jgi:hypothetical protein
MPSSLHYLYSQKKIICVKKERIDPRRPGELAVSRESEHKEVESQCSAVTTTKMSATVEHWLFDLHTPRVATKGILVATRKGYLVTISLYSDKRALQFDFQRRTAQTIA